MPKTVTLRLNEKVYNLFRNLAESENRPLSNFIETSVLRFIEDNQFVDEYEMAEIQRNKELNMSLKRAIRDVKTKKGRFCSIPRRRDKRLKRYTPVSDPEKKPPRPTSTKTTKI